MPPPSKPTAVGRKEVLGIWIVTTEGAKFWLRVVNELKARGVGDVLLAVCDGLTGLPDAVNAVWPRTKVQTCMVCAGEDAWRWSYGALPSVEGTVRSHRDQRLWCDPDHDPVQHPH